ncbi:MAG: LysR family transcriptional regulator [Rhodospirillaceae bacterium]|jgi:LysR family transcriptional regulator, nitrogen assimilation regulatory protein|nr:LysR family transcriptional regulator [Rhodospirillaceae bacterium]
MDLRQLRYFAAVAEYGSFSEAAGRLRVAQSALSRHTLTLEQELGVKLFGRHPRGVTLTPSGTLLLARAKNILAEMEEARAEVMAQAALPSGDAVIGTTSTTSRILYGPLAARFARDYPNVRLRFVEGVPYLLLEGLDTGTIDLAVMVDPEPRESLVLEPLVTEQEFLIGTLKANLPPEPCTIEALTGMPLILLPRPAGSRVKLDRMASDAGVALDVTHEVANIDVVKDFVERGLGFGILPYSSVMAGVEEGRYQAVPLDGLTITRTLVRRSDRAPTPAVVELTRLVHDEIDQMIQAGGFGAVTP